MSGGALFQEDRSESASWLALLKGSIDDSLAIQARIVVTLVSCNCLTLQEIPEAVVSHCKWYLRQLSSTSRATTKIITNQQYSNGM